MVHTAAFIRLEEKQISLLQFADAGNFLPGALVGKARCIEPGAIDPCLTKAPVDKTGAVKGVRSLIPQHILAAQLALGSLDDLVCLGIGFGGGSSLFIFGGFGSGRVRDPNGPIRGEHREAQVTISFMEAVKGCTRDIKVSRLENCSECGGSGAKKGTSPETCPDCHGTGQVTVRRQTAIGVMQMQQPCARCGGRGRIIKEPCPKCGGKGRVKVSKTVTVNIPAGIDDGQTVAVRGQGDSGRNGGPAGDLRVTVSVRPDPLFERDGYDIWCEIPITFAQAAMGDDIVVPTVDGKVSYHVPEGTQSGTVFRLRDKGVPALNGRGRGDQYVRVVVEVPKSMTKAQKDKLREFDAALSDKNYQKRKSFTERLRDCFSDK